MKRQVTITVECPEEFTQEHVEHLIHECVKIGLADASDSAGDPDIDNPDADDAAQLEIV